MATVVVNRVDLIEFKNIAPGAAADSHPTLVAQTGMWQTNTGDETGVVFDVAGVEAPLLTPADARKLAKWLNKAADELDGSMTVKKKNKARRQRFDEDDDNDDY